jgi:CheY-like chemotaxis protein
VPEKLSTPDDGRQAVVLLVEDDPDVPAYTGMVLRRLAGARVLDVAGADAALAVLAAEDVDVVVTDIDLLPGAHGLELTAHVRERYPLLPVVVVLSGHATFDHAVVAMRVRPSSSRSRWTPTGGATNARAGPRRRRAPRTSPRDRRRPSARAGRCPRSCSSARARRRVGARGRAAPPRPAPSPASG